MARQGRRVLRGRKGELSDDDSLLVRSAESLGRVIGSLQRQVQGSVKRGSPPGDGSSETLADAPPRVDGRFAATGTKARNRSGDRKTPAGKTAARKTAGARTSASTRKTAGARKRSGSRKQAARGASSKKR